jgi:calcineurin-like phosphoesterase family protein
MNWYTADLHCFHTNIIAFDQRPFASLDEMHETLVRNWNAVVRAKDRVYVCGDIAFGNPKRFAPLLARLQGQIVLIRGNHDIQNGFKLSRLIVDGKSMFHDYADIKYIKIADKWVCLSHYPYGDERFFEMAPNDRGHWLIHGHSHNTNPAIVRDRMINVGTMLWKYTPVSETQILAIMNGGEPWKK